MRRRGGQRLPWWLLLCTLLGAACEGDSWEGGRAKVGDEVLLVQASTQRHRSGLRRGANGTVAMFDVDGCPATDPNQAYFGACGRLGAKEWLVRGAEAHCGVSGQSEPREGEKLVTFMRHATPLCCTDCGLSPEGQDQCRGLKANNKLLLEGPLSASQPVEAVYTSPATRAMETSIRIFGDTGAHFFIDTRLVEKSAFLHCRRCEQALLEQTTNHPELLEQWNTIFPNETSKPWTDWHAAAGARAANFTQHLLRRPERRVAVVAHFLLLGSFPLGMGCMRMGETVVQAVLRSDGTWRQASVGSCSGRRRRWKDWGNYRRRREGDA